MQKILNKIKAKFTEINISEIVARYKPYYIGILVILVLISTYHIYFSQKIITGVTVAGQDLGGLSYKRALSKLESMDKENEKKISFIYSGEAYELFASDIDLNFNWEAVVSRAFEVGRTGDLYVDSKDKIAGFFKDLIIPTYYDFEETNFNNFMANVRGLIDVPAENAKFEITDETLEIINENSGLRVDEKALYDTLISSFNYYKFGEYEVVVDVEDPKVLASDLEKVKEEASDIIFNNITITHENMEWEPTNEKKLEFLTFEKEEDYLGFDKARFKTYLDTIASDVNKLPRGTVITNDENRVTGFVLTQDGSQINVDESLEAFKEAYFNLESETALVLEKVTGPIDPEKYGILSLIGEGTSKFTGSAPGRIKNLSLAAQRTNGVLVPPGSVYSLNDSIGEISAATGYDSAWIILGSRTVLGSGGGVCQTSTTLFRAILNAGLPVVSRHPHAYRVSYYEIESPIGIDASIYQPSLDLQFKNDTPNYLLIESEVTLEEDRLTFRIYGTPDGREVEITEPVVTSQSPPPAPLYQDDPTLPKGVVRQVDFAAPGARVSFTRTVTRDGEVLYDDVFKTNYQPWRAVYLVGTKE